MKYLKEQIAEVITQTHKTPMEQAVEILLLFGVSGSLPHDAVFDTHQKRVYKLSECDKEMLDAFPTRYLHILLSDKLKEGNDR